MHYSRILNVIYSVSFFLLFVHLICVLEQARFRGLNLLYISWVSQKKNSPYYKLFKPEKDEYAGDQNQYLRVYNLNTLQSQLIVEYCKNNKYIYAESVNYSNENSYLVIYSQNTNLIQFLSKL